MAGRLILCGTPIGNLGDAPPRLAEALGRADLIYSEDTRRAATLLRSLGVRATARSYFAGNEAQRAEELAGHLEAGRTVALLTDAGMPAVSDPGVSAVRAARRVGAEITVVPGPSALTAALAVSGLPSERFCFEGFLPRRGGDRRARLAAIAAEVRTMVLFTSPHRLAADLADLAGTCGPDRAVVVTRELTKRFEEAWWGTLGESLGRWTEPKGEFTLVLAGAEPVVGDLAAAAGRVEELVANRESPADAVRRVAGELGLSRRALYQAVLDRRDRASRRRAGSGNLDRPTSP